MADLRFGTFLAPNLLTTYQSIADHVGARLGLSTELVVETDYEACLEDVNDVCFVCSLPYVIFEREGLAPAVPVAAPVLEGDRYEGRPIYFSDVIVRRDDPARSFLDLRGSRWAYNEPLSQSGYGITRFHLLSLRETDGFFGEVIETGFHERSIEMVLEGRVDASAIDSHVLSVAFRDDPLLSGRVRVVESLGPSTVQPVAVSKRLPLDVREAITQSLCDLENSDDGRRALASGMMQRMVRVGPGHYDDIRNMLAACERAGFLQIE